jgi:predicted Zn finger-like uncharacterized protein
MVAVSLLQHTGNKGQNGHPVGTWDWYDMRLICPNCDAQYEVDDSVIPEGGRDVQCSNCGHAWYQPSAEQVRAAEEALAARASGYQHPEETPEPEPEPEPVAEAPEPEPEVVEEPAEPEPELDQEEAAEPEPEPVAEEPAPVAAEMVSDVPPETEKLAQDARELKRRALDESVLNVLREEADREARARKSEGTSLESQPDLGLAGAAGTGVAASALVASQHAGDTDEHIARLHDDGEDVLDAAKAPRRELLPDIEEINSTLRATSERGGDAAARDAPETIRRRKSGFRLGFSLSLLVALFMLAAYALAPFLSERMPGLAPALSGYVATVNKGRIWLDEKMRVSTEAMRGSAADK